MTKGRLLQGLLSIRGAIGAVCSLCLSILVFVVPSAYANPVLDHVANGSVSIQQSATTTQVNQSSQNAIINWHSFNIGAGESTHFQQPVNGVALNRINPSQGASQIYGHLSATGRIILTNSAGIYFGPSAYVNVGGLIASTSDITDQNFLNGNYTFDQVSPNAGMIINQGTIIAAQNGLVALMGNGVQNDGTIEAHFGTVLLASGEQLTMSFSGNDLISFAVTGNAKKGVTNTAALNATGGTIIAAASMAANAMDNAINMQGVVSANSVYQRGGTIVLSGGKQGKVRVNARLNASGNQGGNITVTGQHINVSESADLNASGELGGGVIYIGGNYQGKGPLPNAYQVYIDTNAKLNVDATLQGHGGSIIIWSDDETAVYGTLSARGRGIGGNGGFIETSGKHSLNVNGIKVDMRAEFGVDGTWLLDPGDITIDSASDSDITASSPFIATATGSVLDVNTLTTALASGNVIVQTTNDGFAGNGDIYVNTPISWSSGNTLTLDAYNDIFINADIDGANPLVLNAGNQINFQANIGTTTPLSSLSLTSGDKTRIHSTRQIITSGNQVYNSPVELIGNLTGNFTATSNAGHIDFYSTINGDSYVTITSNQTTLHGAVGDIHRPLTLTMYNSVGSDYINAGSIMTHGGGQAYHGAIVVGADTNFNTLKDDITFYSTLDGAFNVTASGGGRNVIFQGAVGSITPLTSLTVGNSRIGVSMGTTPITTTGLQDYQGVVNFQSDSTVILTSSSGDINFQSSVNGQAALTINAGNIITFYDNVGYNTRLTSLTINGPLVISDGLTVESNDFQNFTDTVTATGSGFSSFATNFTDADITFAKSLSWDTGDYLGVYSEGDIYFGGPVTGTAIGSVLDLYAVGNIVTGPLASVNVYDFSIDDGSWVQIGTSLPAFNVIHDFNLNYGTLPDPLVNFVRATGGDGSVGNPYTIVDIYGLQGIASNTTTLASHYKLVNDLDATNTSNWSYLYGFVPIGTALDPFTGSFDGQGYQIQNLYINTTIDDVGLFGYASSGASMMNVEVSGSVTGNNQVGLLVGNNQGTISASSASGDVYGFENVGGLVGLNNGSISNAYAQVSVDGQTNRIGGFVGLNDVSGVISKTYSAGSVTLLGTNVGGFAGVNNNMVSNSFWDTNVSNLTNAVGGGSASGMTGGCLSGSSCLGGASADLSAQLTFANVGWNFSTVWGIDEGVSYPFFGSSVPPTPIPPTPIPPDPNPVPDPIVPPDNTVVIEDSSNVSRILEQADLTLLKLDVFDSETVEDYINTNAITKIPCNFSVSAGLTVALSCAAGAR